MTCMDRPPSDHGSDRHGYVEISYSPSVPAEDPWPVPSDDLVAEARCSDCLSNLFFRWDGERWTYTVAHDDGCPTFARIEREGR